MNMKIKIFLMFIIAAFVFSCGDDNMNQPRGNSVVPKQILNPRVKNIPGGAVIYYDRPDDNNLRYVKAEYTTDDGVNMDATASFFTDSILVCGFRDVCNVTVNLYSVNASEVKSEPVKVQISPETPQYKLAFANLQINPTFGGVRVLASNETGEKLTIAVYKKDPANDKFEEISLNFTDWNEINFKVMGQDPVENVFMAKVRDLWGHWSEEKVVAITPWFEEQLNKRLFREVRLCNITEGYSGEGVLDQTGFLLPSNYWGHFMHWWSGSDVRFEYLWDNEYGTSTGKCYHSRPTSVLPQHFTIDLGASYKLSRLIVHGRLSDTEMGAGSNDTQRVYRNGFPKHVQLYGATYDGPDMMQLHDDINNPDYWIDLGHYYLRRADGSLDMITGAGTGAGADFGTLEDRIQLQEGHELEIPEWAPKIRYFRFRTLECYNPAVNAVMLGEVTLYGDGR
jgi:hypothetical protein